jgi:3'-phosphoadenosine 5'-phosphosulfate sulfotransferase (PAPS reductase)/FAD synthetase
MTGAALGRKQSLTQAQWLEVFHTIQERVPQDTLDQAVAQTVAEIHHVTQGKRVAFGWSGGKDSLVLEQLCYFAGIQDCLMGLTDLQYPAFLAWVTAHMPAHLELVMTGLDLDWLVQHQGMLFPQDAKTAAKWFKLVQHSAQERYYREHALDMLIIGRRTADGNYVGGPELDFCPFVRHWVE